MPLRAHASSPTSRSGLEIAPYFDGACPLCSVEIAHYAGQRGGDALNLVALAAYGLARLVERIAP
jgi:hypothetical protein